MWIIFWVILSSTAIQYMFLNAIGLLNLSPVVSLLQSGAS